MTGMTTKRLLTLAGWRAHAGSLTQAMVHDMHDSDLRQGQDQRLAAAALVS